MPSTSETGHAKNVANFEALITVCKGYGVTYNPSRVAIGLPALTALLDSAQNTIRALKVIETAYDNATNAREIAFEPLKKLCTRVINALKATEATQQTVNDAATSNLKIQGRRATPKKAPVPAKEGLQLDQPKTISTSQQSFDSLIENFGSLIETLKAEPLFTPNETDLQVAQLTALIADLTTKNKGAAAAETDYDNALIARNKILYAPETGLYDITVSIKTYARSVFKKGSPELKQLTDLKFTDL